jgi:uncharacterized protein YndB with AHSA1/START domain
MSSDTDRIVKKIVLRAKRARVWRAISDSQEFGAWFGMRVAGPFVAGKSVHATIVPTEVDPEIAKHQKEFEGLPFELDVVDVEPERLLSFRWVPHAVERGKDYSREPKTLVSFELRDVDGGVELTVTESGFDRVPLERRAKAFTNNEQGWGVVVHLVQKYLALHAA